MEVGPHHHGIWTETHPHYPEARVKTHPHYSEARVETHPRYPEARFHQVARTLKGLNQAPRKSSAWLEKLCTRMLRTDAEVVVKTSILIAETLFSDPANEGAMYHWMCNEM